MYKFIFIPLFITSLLVAEEQRPDLSCIKSREEIAPQDRWNVEALYPSFAVWGEEFKKWGREGQEKKWPELAAYQGTLGQGPDQVKGFLDLYCSYRRELEKLLTFAQLQNDAQTTNDEAKSSLGRGLSIVYDFQSETSWVQPELLALPDEVLNGYLKADALKDYRFYLEQMVRLKPHTLNAKEEALMAIAGKPLEASQRAFSAFNNSDLHFPQVEDGQGEMRDLTNGSYGLYQQDKDRTLRKNSFMAMLDSYGKWENLLCEVLQGQVQTHIFEAKARSYASSLEAALFPNQIDPSVYRNLIATTKQHLSGLHRYVALKKKMLKLDELHVYDLYVSMVGETDTKYTYDEAVEIVLNAVAPLGKEYQAILSKGLKSDRWVDRYECEGKRSGAYSSVCFDSMPYILLNYQGGIYDVFTLAHEGGHSMQSYLSNHNQPYQYFQYPIFVAEVASIFNEELLASYLLDTTTDKKQKVSLLNRRIDDIRSTFFRQVLFAEFELKIHELVEQNQPLTPALLKQEYRKLIQEYYGPTVVLDPQIEMEWARIPHFYYNFYVYQYATGISAAYALLEKVKKEGPVARDRYLAFLSAGGSKYPLDLLRDAGVDMSSPEPITTLIERFNHMVDQLEQLLKEE